MDQPRLIYEDFDDALRDLVRAIGGPKAVGAKLRPELPVDQSATWVRDCLNAQRREQFHPGQVLLLLRMGRDVNFHAAKHFLDDDTGYTRTAPAEPADEVAQLQRTFIESVGMQRQLVERIERLTRAPLAAVKGVA